MAQNQKVLKKILNFENTIRSNKKKIARHAQLLERNKAHMSDKEILGKESLIRSLENQNEILLRKIEQLELKINAKKSKNS